MLPRFMNRYFLGGIFKTPARHINLVNPIFIEREFRGGGWWLLVPEITDKLNTFLESQSHCGMSQC